MLLRASAKRLFESLMEQTTDRIYIKDKKSRFIAASQALSRLHGFESRHDLEGLTDFDLFSKEHAQQAYDDEQEILTHRGSRSTKSRRDLGRRRRHLGLHHKSASLPELGQACRHHRYFARRHPGTDGTE